MGTYLVVSVVAAAVGVVIAWAILRARQAGAEQRIASLSAELLARSAELTAARAEAKAQQVAASEATARLAAAEATLQAERRSADEKLAAVLEAREQMERAFGDLSAKALQHNNQAFLTLAEQKLSSASNEASQDLQARKDAIEALLSPLRSTLTEYQARLREIEAARENAYGELRATLQTVNSTQESLRAETSLLVTALRRTGVRGRWGELTLKRVVELAGMAEHCDFVEQQTVSGENKTIRPDMIVQLPGGLIVPVDAKAPFDAYIEAVQATSEEDRRRHLARHAEHVRGHVQALSSREYYKQFELAPEFTLLFLPGESFFSAAAETDPQLIEWALEKKVLIATPMSLMALLKTVANSWRQQKVEENARAISALAKEFYSRLATMANYFDDVGSSLAKAVDSYNRSVRSLESRVMVSARRLVEMGAAEGDLEELTEVERIPRGLTVPGPQPVELPAPPPLLEKTEAAGK